MNAPLHAPALGALRPGEARLNITFDGQNVDFDAPVPFGASEAELKRWARESIAGGALGAERPAHAVDLDQHVIDRFPATAKVPHNRIFLRPLTPFG